MKTKRTVSLCLVGLDSNAFAILGAFRRQAQKEGWSKEEIKEVTKNAMSGDYNHLLRVIADHCDSHSDVIEE